MKLPQFTIATKLYAIFALLATVTVGPAIVAVVNARHHAALTNEFKAAATQEIARSVETAARHTGETAGDVGRVGKATAATRESADAVRVVANELGSAA